MSRPKYVAPNGGNLYEFVNNMRVKVTSQETKGAYDVCEERCPPGFASKPHLYVEAHETFFIIKGTATFIWVMRRMTG